MTGRWGGGGGGEEREGGGGGKRAGRRWGGREREGSDGEGGTPSPKQPFSFLGRLAINNYLALCQQESDSVACGSEWLTVHSGG